MFLDLKGREVLICGGGSVAKERIERLLPFEAKIKVVAEKIDDAIKSARISWEERGFSAEDLNCRPVFVLICDEENAPAIYSECEKRHVPVNTADVPSLCDFVFPAVKTGKNYCVGVSTGGLSPTAASVLKSLVEDALPSNADDIIQWLSKLRAELKQTVPPKLRRRVLRTACERAFSLNRPLTAAELKDVAESQK